MSVINYERFTTPCDLTLASLEWAITKLPGSKAYTLYVSNEEFIKVKRFLRHWTAVGEDNPFAPQVNLYPLDGLKEYEWFINAYGHDTAIGSEGT